MDADVSAARDEGAQWEDIYRKFVEVTGMLAWAEQATSPGDAATVELPAEQASAISFCIRRARVQLQEIHRRLQDLSGQEAHAAEGQDIETGM